MTNKRWQRSLINLGNALNRLSEILDVPLDEHDYILDATIQRFEFVTELFWKTLKHLLATQGINAHLPKDILQQAYAAHWIDQEKLWLNMLYDRSLTSHTYKQDQALAIYEHLKIYYPAMRSTYECLENKFNAHNE